MASPAPSALPCCSLSASLIAMNPPEKIESVELGEAMEALSAKEQAFVRALFLPGTTAADAAAIAGYGAPDGSTTRKNYARIAFRLKSRASIVRAIVEESARTVKSLGPEALQGMREILADKKNKDRGKMIRFIVEKIDPALMLHQHQHRHEHNIKIDHEAEAIKILRWMRDELGVPREKLIEHFGHSGLGRYEKMLAEQGPKLIEASPAEENPPPGAVTSRPHRLVDAGE